MLSFLLRRTTNIPFLTGEKKPSLCWQKMELNWKKSVKAANKVSALGLAMLPSDAFRPLVFATSAPEGLLKVPRGTQNRPHSVVAATCQPQPNPISIAASSAFSPVDSNHSKPQSKHLSERLASVFSHEDNHEDNGGEDSEIASALSQLSLSTTVASGRAHQRSAPLPEHTAKEKEQRIILTTKSQTWHHAPPRPQAPQLLSRDAFQRQARQAMPGTDNQFSHRNQHRTDCQKAPSYPSPRTAEANTVNSPPL